MNLLAVEVELLKPHASCCITPWCLLRPWGIRARVSAMVHARAKPKLDVQYIHRYDLFDASPVLARCRSSWWRRTPSSTCTG